MKKTLTIFTLIFALLLTAGCAASNLAQDEQIAVMAAAGSDAAGEAAPITMDDAQAIALTHGNPVAYLPGAMIAELISRCVYHPDQPLVELVEATVHSFEERFGRD